MAVTLIEVSASGGKLGPGGLTGHKKQTSKVLINLATIVTAAAAVATDVATLVADGATPTQAHVTTLNTDWGTLNTAIAAATGSNVIAGADVAVLLDTTAVATHSKLRALIVELLQLLAGNGALTP